METEGVIKSVPFLDVLEDNPRNGVYKPKQFHGRGHRVVNMGELFAYPKLGNQEMQRIELSASESRRFELRRGDLLFARRSLVAEGRAKK